MEYHLHQIDKLLKDIEERLKEYCEKKEDPDCFGGRLRLKIEPSELFLSQVSNAIENLKQIVYFGRLIMFTFHIEDIVEKQTIVNIYFNTKKMAWIVEYLV